MKKSILNSTFLYQPIHSVFEEGIKMELNKYLAKHGHNKRWMMYSDYSFDKNKPNDVITFSFLPFYTNWDDLNDGINNHFMQKEIKHTRTVQSYTTYFLRHSEFLNFEVVLENYDKWGYKTHEILRMNLIKEIEYFTQDAFPRWIQNNPSDKNSLVKSKKIFDNVLDLLKNDKKVQIIKNILTITAIGTYLAGQIVKLTNAEKMGWFSDRDAINDIGIKKKTFSSHIFNALLNEVVYTLNDFEIPKCNFSYTSAQSSDDDWYSGAVKIPDYLNGTIADFDFKTKKNSHPKFEPIMKDVIADNTYNNFVLKVDFQNNPEINCSYLTFTKETL